MENIDYIVISPVRNEEKYIVYTLDSVTSQTILPKKWVIVNDGSKDKTRDIIEKYADKYNWILLINCPDRGYAEPGYGVMEAFYNGYQVVRNEKFDYIVKLDGDLTFEKEYFEKLFIIFLQNPNLGIASGVCYIKNDNSVIREKHPKFHVRGPSKVYKKKCWDDIGGLEKTLGWDTIDEVKANYLGWHTESFPELKIIHHKPTGYNTGSYKWAIKLGESNYYCGYHPAFMLAKIFKRMLEKPYLMGGLNLGYGYISKYIKNANRYHDEKIIKYLQSEQIKTLTFRKSLWNE